jgi:UDP-GlcNAc:undecaprenyl-phosphate GlcNAc-1-phosphate transferase
MLRAITSVPLMVAAVFASLLILVKADYLGTRLQIMDHPDTVRKKHARVTPLVAGLAIVVPTLMWCAGSLALHVYPDSRLLLVVLLCGAGATVVGYADDQSSTSPSSRIFSLLLLTSVALVIDPALLPRTFNWGSFDPTPVTAWFGFSFIAIAMAGYVNAVNMADGQNGVVIGMYVIWSLCLALVTHGTISAVSLTLLVTALVAFTFNMQGRVFLGDSGTYGVSFVFGLLAISAHNEWGVSAETIAVWFFIPIVDCLRLMMTRALQGQVPSDADRDHFHHRLQDRIGTSFGLLIYLGAVGISSVIATFVPQLSLVCMIVLAAFYFSFAWLTAADEKAIVSNEDDETMILPSTGKVVKFDGKVLSGSK